MISHNNLHFSLIFSHFYVKIAILSNKNAEKSLFYCTFVTTKTGVPYLHTQTYLE